MPMDFAAASQRVRGLLAPKKAHELSRSALTEDPLRDRIIRDAGRTNERYQATKRDVPQFEVERDGQTHTFEWSTFGEAIEDYARAAFSYLPPTVRKSADVAPSHRLNREVIAATTAAQAFQESFPYTSGSEAESIYGAMAYAESLEESARTLLSEHVERSEQLGEAEQGQRTADEMFEDLRRRAREENAEHGTVQKGTRREIKQALQAQEQANAKLGELVQQQNASGLPLAAIRAAEKAQAAAHDAVEAMEGIGALAGLGGGHSQNMTPDQQIALAEKWSVNPTLRKILKNVGRMIRAMHFAREARLKNVPAEPVGITLGNDLERVIPHELARAVSPHPLIQATFMRDFANHALLEWEIEGKAPAGKGDIIEIHDGSGSMMSPEEKFVWATSLGLALLSVAQRENRNFAGVEFGSQGQLKSWVFPKGETPDADQVLDFASHFFGGGTSTLSGLREALRIYKESPGFKSADLVLIGDGIDHVTDEDRKIRDELRELGVRIHGISILHRNNAYMQEICDYTDDVTDLAGPNDASESLAQNIT